MSGKDEFWDAWWAAPTAITDIKENTNMTVTATRLVYLEDVAPGAVLRFSRCKKPTAEQQEQMTATPIQMLFGGYQHEEEDYDLTVLDKREQGGVVSLILVDQDGEQQSHLDMGIKTVRVVVQ